MKGTRRENQSIYIMLAVMNPGVVVKLDGSYQDSLVNLALEISQEKDLKRKPAGLKGSKGGDKQYVKISPHKKNWTTLFTTPLFMTIQGVNDIQFCNLSCVKVCQKIHFLKLN